MEFSESAIIDCMDVSSRDLCQSIINEVKSRPPVTVSMLDGASFKLHNEMEARRFLKLKFKWEGSED